MFHIQAGQKIIIHKIASTTPAIAYKSCVETLRKVSYKINLINRKVKDIANLGGEQPILAEFISVGFLALKTTRSAITSP